MFLRMLVKGSRHPVTELPQISGRDKVLNVRFDIPANGSFS